MQELTIIETILRDRQDFFQEIRAGVGIKAKVGAMLLSCFVFLASYGFILGASHSLLQAAAAMLKLPLLFVATLAICAPSLHFFNVLFGSKQTIGQTISLILTAITTSAVLLFSLAPITLFFLLSSSQYDFYKLLNVLFFAIAGLLGVSFLQQGMHIVTEDENDPARRTIFSLWVVLYGFVGDPDKPFILFNQADGNFYTNVLESLRHLLS